MNYNNYKRHSYDILWIADKDGDTYKNIFIEIIRDSTILDSNATEINEVKYACRNNKFDFDSLDRDLFGRWYIKRGSKEWDNYMAEPGTLINKDEYDASFINHVRDLISPRIHVIAYAS